MAIGAGSAIEFFGAPDTLGTSTSAVTNGSFSDGVNDLLAWTNDDDASFATAALEFTTATTGGAGTTIDLYARLMNIGDAGTEDAEVPDANFQNKYLGSFPHNNPSTAAQAYAIEIGLTNVSTSQIYEFYIHNNTGVTVSAGWDLTITPKAVGPHA